MPRALVLQHIRCEPPGLFSGMLNERGVAIETIELDEGGELPDRREVDLVVAMGGPMGALRRGRASLAGRRRSGGSRPRCGPACPTSASASAPSCSPRASARRSTPGETPGGRRAARRRGRRRGRATRCSACSAHSSRPCSGTATRSASRPARSTSPGPPPTRTRRSGSVQPAYAVQFHVEVTGEMLAEWGHVPAYQKSAEAVLGSSGFETLAAGVRRCPGPRWRGPRRSCSPAGSTRPGGGPAQHRRPPVTTG